MSLFEKHASLRYVFISIAVLVAAVLSALWVYSGSWFICSY